MPDDRYADRDAPHRDEDLLRELYCEQRLNVNEIGEKIGSSPSTVWRWVEKFGLERPEEPRPWQDRETLEWMFCERGYSRQEIADRFGIWRRTVNRWLRKYDLQPDTQSRRFGRLAIIPGGYVHFVDYNGPGDNNYVLIHRLLALRDNPLEEVADKHVHHKNRIPWDNRPENLELMVPSEHTRHHQLSDPGN